MNTTWRKELEYEMTDKKDLGPIIHYAPNESVFDVEFDDSYGGKEGEYVLAWTTTRVYFPVTYDGSESIGSAPRNPQSEGQVHVGGG